MELHEFEDVWIHLFRGVKAPDEVQMFPVLDVLVEDQVGDLSQRDRTAQNTNGKYRPRKYLIHRLSFYIHSLYISNVL